MGTRRAALHLDLFEQPGQKRVFQHHDDAHLPINLLHVPQDFQAAHRRQTHIQEDEVGVLRTACQPAGDPPGFRDGDPSNASRTTRMTAA